MAPFRTVVTFDRPLTPGPVDFANWRARHGNEKYNGAVTATAAGSTVTCRQVVGFGDVGPNVVHYDAIAPDVLSSFGVPAAAFANFPIT